MPDFLCMQNVYARALCELAIKIKMYSSLLAVCLGDFGEKEAVQGKKVKEDCI